MALDSFIQVPADSVGKKVDTDQVVVGANTVQRQRVQVTGAGATDIARTNASEGLSTSLSVLSASRTHGTSASVAAGGQVDVDATQISSGLTGKLIQVIVSSSVPFKAELKTVLNASASGTLVTWIGHQVDCTFASKKFINVAHNAGAGIDTFRMTITNLDTVSAADVYATFFYDEE
jgi:hypothetical protein